jgi:hypothetical protein
VAEGAQSSGADGDSRRLMGRPRGARTGLSQGGPLGRKELVRGPRWRLANGLVDRLGPMNSILFGLIQKIQLP